MAKALLIIALLLTAAQAHAADDWSKQDVARAVGYTALHVLDWGQTLNLARHPERYEEANTLFGKHPSVGKVNTIMAAELAVYYLAAHHLPAKHRAWFQIVAIGIRSTVVGWNFSIGVKASY